MDYLFVEILAPIITGCLVAYFVYWLDKRDE
ncbi:MULTISPECIES: type I toxin-antitoxin system Fst family toxin [Jeotgalicoccus]|uniref:Type I toxin-antitoxin system Fst family toxin n=1 Tax=Jeotgalicoccus nanhaiensis TaxID=568603 RepID=A0ABR9XWY1_9STAP|nr:type I toxin-antitoxin system Fst family toxin [Jeotgalicoccus nanhaiensis]MBF0753469.1 type I toxin-antitoxin system Fst family toxin [Jeotgalicoccus nanhaiensis]TFU62627.1 type I toxin-antitoxin system Fst family toxin [Jeotgalicoccus nanhaiensis]